MSHVLLRKSADFFCGISEKQDPTMKDKRQKEKDKRWECENLGI